MGLVGDLFALPGSANNEQFHSVFSEFLKRLTDRIVAVRMSVLEHVKSCLLTDPSRADAPQILSKCIICLQINVTAALLIFLLFNFSSCTL